MKKLRLRQIAVEDVKMGDLPLVVAFRTDEKNPMAVAQGPAVLEFVDDETGEIFPVESLTLPTHQIIRAEPGQKPVLPG